MRRWLQLTWLMCLLLAVPANAQSIIERLITPGPLSSVHGGLEDKCDSCHSSFRKQAQNRKCTACHKGVGSDIARKTRYHGKHSLARTGSCKTCHSEHKGRGYALIRLDRNRFDHGLTNYPLTGAHARANCSACHGTGNNYRGISTSCAACHKKDDPHRGQLGQTCQSCHSTQGWKAVSGFEHARTGFALTGAHRQASCLACHAGQRWKGLGRSCVACHAKDDAHQGSRGTNCASCHGTSTWRSATFDHASTGFPLRGAHAAATCAGCHGAGNTNPNPARTCHACHAKDDVHKGGRGRDCANCHTVSSWKKVDFDHDTMTAFPLVGKHAAIACETCHTAPPRDTKLSADCASCHAKDDPHAGKLGNKCATCHDSTNWKGNVRFAHDLTRFPLLGKHEALECAACHADRTFAAKGITCASCHADDRHKGAFGTPAACRTCHNASDWKAWSFDHDTATRFSLTGRHQGLICSACHVRSGDPAKLGSQCIDCHRRDDVHRGGFGEDCERCHVTSGFQQLLMNGKQ